MDPPAGVEIREGLHYNPYFVGGAIAMGRVLYDDLVEYDDGKARHRFYHLKSLYQRLLGTPATTSQMAKDVSTFLAWAAEPEHDERKKTGLKALIVLFALFGASVWAKRNKWSYVKARKLVYNPPKR